MPRLGETTRDIEAIRAINAARYAQPRGGSRTGRKPSQMWTFYRDGYTVKPYRPRKLYSNSTDSKARYSHLTRFGWKATHDGKPTVTCVRYLCGGTTFHAVVADEPTMPVCPKCRIAFVGYAEAADALDSMYNEMSI